MGTTLPGSPGREKQLAALKKHQFKPGQVGNPTGTNSAKRLTEEIREMARAAAPEAFKRLVWLVKNGSAAVQVQAAKAVLGVAGVSTQPTSTMRHTHELLPAPPTLSAAELVALVRGDPALPPKGGPAGSDMDVIGAMASSAGSAVTPAAAGSARTHPSIDVEFRAVTSSEPKAQGSTSGSTPDGPGGVK